MRRMAKNSIGKCLFSSRSSDETYCTAKDMPQSTMTMETATRESRVPSTMAKMQKKPVSRRPKDDEPTQSAQIRANTQTRALTLAREHKKKNKTKKISAKRFARERRPNECARLNSNLITAKIHDIYSTMRFAVSFLFFYFVSLFIFCRRFCTPKKSDHPNEFKEPKNGNRKNLLQQTTTTETKRNGKISAAEPFFWYFQRTKVECDAQEIESRKIRTKIDTKSAWLWMKHFLLIAKNKT